MDRRRRNAREGEARRRCRNERGAKRENRAFSVFWLERNPRGERGVKARRRGADTFE